MENVIPSGAGQPENILSSGAISKGCSEVYLRHPIEYIKEIPVFSALDDYSANYERIAHDHLAFTKKTGKNPFMEEDSWVDLDVSTANLIRKYGSPRNLILDVGVGLGRILGNFDMLQRFGMDISPEYLEQARIKGIEVCLSRIEDMPYKQDTFDIIVCTDVLEHVLDLNLCIRKILLCLKPGGYMIIRVPYREDLSAYTSPDFPYRYAHLRSFDEYSLILLFNRIFGIEVVEYMTVGRRLDWSRMVYRLPIGNRSFAKAMRFTKRYLPTLGAALSFKLFTPIEINFVVRKPLS